VPANVTVRTDGIEETLDALKGLDRDLRAEANGEIREAAREAAGGLVLALQAAAASSPTPQARLVAQAAKVKSDRFPTVVLGGSKKVGHRGTPAGRLAWGSEQGGEHFAAPAGGAYWIAPTVRRFETAGAVPIFKRKLYEVIRRHGLDA
jgi:hypothetical protein